MKNLPFDIKESIARQSPNVKDAVNFMMAFAVPGEERDDVVGMLRPRQGQTKRAFEALATSPAAKQKLRAETAIRPQASDFDVMGTQDAVRLFVLAAGAPKGLHKPYNPHIHAASAPHLTQISPQTLRWMVAADIREPLQEEMLKSAVLALNDRYLYRMLGYLPGEEIYCAAEEDAVRLCEIIRSACLTPPPRRVATTLSLAGYQYEELPIAIGRLKYLTAIDAPGSKIRAFPAEIALLPNLQHINVANCKNLLDPDKHPEVRWHTLPQAKPPKDGTAACRVPVWRTPWNSVPDGAAERTIEPKRAIAAPILDRIAARALAARQEDKRLHDAVRVAAQLTAINEGPKPAYMSILAASLLSSLVLTSTIIYTTSGLSLAISVGWAVWIGLFQLPQYLSYAVLVFFSEDAAKAVGRVWGLRRGVRDLQSALDSGFMTPSDQRACLARSRQTLQHERSPVLILAGMIAASLTILSLTTGACIVYPPLYGLMAFGPAGMMAFYMLPTLAALIFACYSGTSVRGHFQNGRDGGYMEVVKQVCAWINTPYSYPQKPWHVPAPVAA